MKKQTTSYFKTVTSFYVIWPRGGRCCLNKVGANQRVWMREAFAHTLRVPDDPTRNGGRVNEICPNEMEGRPQNHLKIR